MLGVWGKFKCTGFFMLLSYSSFFTINSDLPVNSLLFYFSRGFYKEKKNWNISQTKQIQFKRSHLGKLALYHILF